ncbi:MAG: Uma2 family endonuclease [Planctomycetota bacterium]|nr:Uma2 family endonuclease [Planctomycetota bacterium]
MEGVSWETYERLRQELDDAGSHVRIIYDQGRMALMSPLLPIHEKWKQLLGRLIETLAEERGLPISAFGSTTWKRQDVGRGIEADQCYYIQHAQAVRGKTAFDLLQDPPPDLAVEVDVTYRPPSKPSVYAALRIPELWRYNGKAFDVLVLQSDGSYASSSASAAFPGFAPADCHRYLSMYPALLDAEIVAEFRKWIRGGHD